MDQPQARHASILVVDDEPALLDMLQFLLETAGYEVAAAGDGQAAMELLLGGLRPDLILLDLMMPRMSGPEFLGKLGEGIPGGAAIPVIVLTAAAPARIHDARLARAAGIIAKPFDVEQLLLAVQERLSSPSKAVS